MLNFFQVLIEVLFLLGAESRHDGHALRFLPQGKARQQQQARDSGAEGVEPHASLQRSSDGNHNQQHLNMSYEYPVYNTR